MPRYRFHVVDVFTDRVFGGNPLAVLPEAEGLEGAAMQAIAREFNLSETVFLLPPETPTGTRKVRIFSPTRELPFAGHPTIGTAALLVATGRVALEGGEGLLVLEERAGPVKVRVRARAGAPVWAQLTAPRLPESGPPPPPADALARALGLEIGEVLVDIEAISCGIPFLFVPVRDRFALARSSARLEPGGPLQTYWARDVFVFSRDPELEGSDVRARMFAPESGILEDPATGSAAAALAGYLAAREAAREGTFRWRIEQGFEMGRPSLLDIEADKEEGGVTATRVGGTTVLVSEGTMEI